MTHYDAYYYQHGCGRPYERTPEWLNFFGGIADKIVAGIGPRTVLDAGCAMGFLVEALRDRGVEAYGLDISEYAIGQVREDIRPYCTVGSLAQPLPRRYDLIISIEVLEHMPPVEAEHAISHFCAASDDVLFSSTPFDYKEATHFNVQSPEVWARQFAHHGFVRDVDFDASFIATWAVRFRRTQELWPRVLSDYERRFWLLWKENTDLRALAVEQRDQLAESDRRFFEQTQTLHLERERLQTAQEHARALETRLNAAIHSPAWKIAQAIQRGRVTIAPPGSRRERWLSAILRALIRA